MEAGPESVRLRIHMVVETGDGKRLAEIAHEPVYHQVLTREDWSLFDRSFRDILNLEVVAPARALVAAHVRKLADQTYIRNDEPLPKAFVDMPKDGMEKLDALLDEIARQRG